MRRTFIRGWEKVNANSRLLPLSRQSPEQPVPDGKKKGGSLLLGFSADERHLLLNQY